MKNPKKPRTFECACCRRCWPAMLCTLCNRKGRHLSLLMNGDRRPDSGDTRERPVGSGWIGDWRRRMNTPI